MHAAWARAFNAGDLEGMLTLYETKAISLPEPGQPISGTEAIRGALADFLAMKGTIELTPVRVIEGDGIALLISDWTLTGIGPDGQPTTMMGQATDVLRRQPDGSWLYAIDNPFGVAR